MADNQSPELFGQTPSQTVGPFFHYGLAWKGGADLTGISDLGARTDLFPEEHYVLAKPSPKGALTGERITIIGRVLDGDDQPVPDAMIEIWQAGPDGRYPDPGDDGGFTGFGRSSTSAEGEFRFETLMPGPVVEPGGRSQAPHIALGVFGRGLLKRLATRVYFEGEPDNERDLVLGLVPPDRRPTLIAQREGGAWRYDIHLQGSAETVFFDI